MQPEASSGPGKTNRIYTGLITVGKYPALSCQSPINAMCWLETRVSHGNVFIHPDEPGVLCLLRQVEIVSKEY